MCRYFLSSYLLEKKIYTTFYYDILYATESNVELQKGDLYHKLKSYPENLGALDASENLIIFKNFYSLPLIWLKILNFIIREAIHAQVITQNVKLTLKRQTDFLGGWV